VDVKRGGQVLDAEVVRLYRYHTDEWCLGREHGGWQMTKAKRVSLIVPLPLACTATTCGAETRDGSMWRRNELIN
jgi:hypothetical protein